MEANDLRVVRQRIDFQHECGGRQDFLAGVALLPVAWTSERLRCAVAGKTTVKVTESGWSPGMMHDFSEAGMSECLDKLAETLPAR